MKNELMIFKNEEFGQVRVVEINGEGWLVGKDVAEALGYTNPLKAIRNHVGEEDKGVNEMDTPGGKQEIILINESGFYSLILRSKLPKAKEFKRWITSEVLPSIRKNGMYATEELLDNPDLLIAAATKLKEERAARIEAENRLRLEEEARKKVEQELAIIEPKAEWYDWVKASEDSLEIGEFAKLITDVKNSIDCGERKLFAKLRACKVLNKKNIPYQQFINKGFFELDRRIYIRNNISTKYFITLITPEGQKYVISKLKRELDKNGKIDWKIN